MTVTVTVLGSQGAGWGLLGFFAVGCFVRLGDSSFFIPTLLSVDEATL